MTEFFMENHFAQKSNLRNSVGQIYIRWKRNI